MISTNGFFTEKIIDLAKKNRDIGIRISIEGLPKANDELSGIKGGFDRGRRTLIELKHMGMKDIGFGITVSDKNAKDLLAMYEFACAMKIEFATATVHNSYYFHKVDNEIVDQEIIAGEFRKLVKEFLKTKTVENWYRAYFSYGIMNYIYGRKKLLPCEAGTELFYMDPLGEIRPCNGMNETMGNIRERTFEEIWNSEEAKRIREKVARCQKNCWMIGSASPAMKKYFWDPTIWIIKNKWLKRDFGGNL